MGGRHQLGGVLLAALAVACAPAPEPLDPTLVGVNRSVEAISELQPVHLVLVMDDSPSMAGETPEVLAALETFFERYRPRFDPDYTGPEAWRIPREFRPPLRFSVTTTSIEARFLESDGTVTEQTTYEGLAGKDCGTSHALTDGDPYPDGAFVSAPGRPETVSTEDLGWDDFVSAALANATVGHCGSPQEQGALAVVRMLERHPDLEASPDGSRPGAGVSVLLVSDEDDCSGAATLARGELDQAGCADAAAAGLLLDLQGLKEAMSARYVRYAALVPGTVETDGLFTPGACETAACTAACTATDPTGDPCWCDAPVGGERYVELARSVVDWATVASVCRPDEAWFFDLPPAMDGGGGERLWLRSVPYNRDPSLVLVKVYRGEETIRCRGPTAAAQTCDGTVDWTYDEVDNAISFCRASEDGRCALYPGDHFELVWLEEACTPDHPCPPATG